MFRDLHITARGSIGIAGKGARLRRKASQLCTQSPYRNANTAWTECVLHPRGFRASSSDYPDFPDSISFPAFQFDSRAKSHIASTPARAGHSSHRRRRTKEGRRSEEHTSELQSHSDLVCRLLLEK